MEKLSRKDKYKDLRTTIDQSPQPVEKKAAPRPAKSIRLAAPDTKADYRKDSDAVSEVMEDVLGEVTQYNLDNGDLVTDDTQMQILYDLSEESRSNQQRSRHFEEMESNEDAGGTTRNIYGTDLSGVAKQASAAPKAPAAKAAESTSLSQTDGEREIEMDELDLFFPGAQQTLQEEVIAEKVEQPVKAASPKKSKPAVQAQKQTPKQVALEPIADEQPKKHHEKVRSRSKPAMQAVRQEAVEKPEGKAATIFMVICSIILIVLIALTIYWMSKLGIF